MNSYIKTIVLFNKDGEKRGVELKEGLNIITGQSKSGKSALLEIIDYCFGSSRSTIPKGKITDFTYLYSIVLSIQNLDIVIGRKNFKDNGRNYIFLKVEKEGINLDSLSLDYYKEDDFIQMKRAIREVESYLGLTITDISKNEEQKSEGRPSIRNMMSYLLQHQNLIASKFALFYRFEDSRKRDKVINEFPVFAGWVDQNYYSTKYKLDTLTRIKKQKEKDIENNKKYLNQKKGKLLETFNNYYMMIGEELDQSLSINELLVLKRKLPNFEEGRYANNQVKVRYFKLKEELERKTRQKHKIDLIISNLEESEKIGQNYLKNLGNLSSKAKVSTPTKDNYFCPLCGIEHTNLNKKANIVLESIEWLEKELGQVEYHKDSYGSEIGKYQKEIYKLESDIKNLRNNVKEIEEMNKEIEVGKNLNEQAIYARAKIDLEVEMLVHNSELLNTDELSNLNGEIENLKEKISGYDIRTRYAEAKTTINKSINNIISNLDFEEEFTPPKIVFELEDTFDLYHLEQKNKSRIYLGEMGSGANWLACHLGLFLGLMRYFCGQLNSPIPKFLFFDQPSQVYFPDTNVTDETALENKDIIAVKKIYETFLNEIENILQETGIKPQIIVTDHVKSLSLDKYDFEDYIRADWFDEKLI